MIYVTGSNGLIGKELTKKLKRFIPISYRNSEPIIDFESNSILIHLSSSITTRNTIEDFQFSYINDVEIPLKIFKQYLEKNPNGKIIFLSSAGDLHTSENNTVVTENSVVKPNSLYGTHKILLENYIKLLHNQYKFSSFIFRVTNVYGSSISSERVNGLVDKLLTTDEKIKIYANLDTEINIIHIEDLINLLLKAINKKVKNENHVFLVGNETFKILEIIKIISKIKNLDVVVQKNKNDVKFINLDCTKVQKYFSWNCEHYLKNLENRGTL